MSKKKEKQHVIQDFTINDCANASKPVRAVRKSTETVSDVSWDEIQDDCDIIEETNEDSTKNFVFKQKKLAEGSVDVRQGNIYPEIIWYLISKHIPPEDVGNFAGINKTTYAIINRKSFWVNLFSKYCENNPRLPERLRVDSCKAYGLRRTVIKALYFTYSVFIKSVLRESVQETCPHLLKGRRCLTVWWCKGITHWSVYFKLKKPIEAKKEEIVDFIEEMGRVDANVEEDTQVLQVICKTSQEVPPVMGMTLAMVSMVLTRGLRNYKLLLGFVTSRIVPKEVVPDCIVVLDAVVGTMVLDWWHPRYPFSSNLVPTREPPLLKEDFFDD